MKRFWWGVAAGAITMLIVLVTIFIAATDVKQAQTTPLTLSRTAEDTLTFGETALTADTVVTEKGPLRNLKVNGDDITVEKDHTTAKKISVNVTIPYPTLSNYFPSDATVNYVNDGELAVETKLSILGRELTVTADCTLAAEDGLLAITPQTINTSAPDWLDRQISALVRSQLTIRRNIEGLPDGLNVTDADVTPTGLNISLQGENVKLATKEDESTSQDPTATPTETP